VLFRWFFILLFPLSLWADPFSDWKLGHISETEFYGKAPFYYAPLDTTQNPHSLLPVTSLINEKPYSGSGFVVLANGHKFLVTNSHLLVGINHPKGLARTCLGEECHAVTNENTLHCVADDISVIDLSSSPFKPKPFAQLEGNQLVVRGANNSPRAYTEGLRTQYNVKGFTNLNPRPLFSLFNASLETEETFQFLQAADMMDRSCNWAPSRPEPYKGTAHLIPMLPHFKGLEEAHEVAYLQKLNRNMFNESQLDFIRSGLGRCVDDKTQPDLRDRPMWSQLTRSLYLPTKAIPGLSGSPLVCSEDTSNPDNYRVCGVVRSHDYQFHWSRFAAPDAIAQCLHAAVNGQRGQRDKLVSIDFDSDLFTTIWSVGNFYEPASCSPASFDHRPSGGGGDGPDTGGGGDGPDTGGGGDGPDTGGGGDGPDTGGGGDGPDTGGGGDGPDTGDPSDKCEGKITTPGLKTNGGDSIIGFDCNEDSNPVSYFAHPSNLIALDRSGMECQPIPLDKMNIALLFQKRSGIGLKRQDECIKTTTGKVCVELTWHSQELSIEVNHNGLSNTFVLNHQGRIIDQKDIVSFVPRLSYSLGENSFVLDIRELFFTDLRWQFQSEVSHLPKIRWAQTNNPTHRRVYEINFR